MARLRRGLWIVAAVVALSGGSALAQTYPARPIRLVVGFTPGGGVDINARLLAPKLTEFLGQQVIVENRPGAGTNIANELVAKSAPDGYTLLINTPAVAINMSLYRKLPYDTLRDFAPVSIFSEAPNVLVVHNGVPAQNGGGAGRARAREARRAQLFLGGVGHDAAPRRASCSSCAPARTSCTCRTRAPRPRSPR